MQPQVTRFFIGACWALLALGGILGRRAIASESSPTSESWVRYQQVRSEAAESLTVLRESPSLGNHFYLPGQSFSAGDAKQRQLADDYAERLIGLAVEFRKTQPAWAYQLLHEAAYFGVDNLADRVVGGDFSSTSGKKRVASKLATRTHSQLKWKRRQYYRITSEHYQIVARDEQTGLEIIERLETLYAVWRQLFFTCWADADALRRAMDAERLLVPRTSRLHRVVLFEDQASYTAHLQKSEPRIGETKGFYDIRLRTSYFYGASKDAGATQIHEASHQLFQELQRASERLPLKQNFWALEGVAMYMESMHRDEHVVSLGGYGAERLQYARYRRLHEDFYVPLQDLVRYGRDNLQQDPDIRRLYSQSAGLTAMFMDGEQRRYRQRFIRYLIAIYDGRDRVDTLSSLLRTDLEQLDSRYPRFLQVDDRGLVEQPVAADQLQALCLGNTRVTNAGLAHIPLQRRLEWLDLAGLPVDLAGLTFLGETRSLRQVSFDRCQKLGDAAVAMIAQNSGLDELDLTGTAVTDQGLGQLAGHAKLQTLWLGGTQITDASLPTLLSLPALSRLQCSGSRLSEAAVSRLRRAKPELVVE